MPTTTTVDLELTELASGLRFPEGPIAMPDGSVILVELFGAGLSRVTPDGRVETVAEIAGGPNGAAIGPDGQIFLCNNGGAFSPFELNGMILPGPFDRSLYIGGRIQVVDPVSGTVEDLYTECDGRPLRAPNDLVMDHSGGFWFTDHGIRDHQARTADLTAIYYARCDGSMIAEVVFPVEGPNGIGLSPDGTKLYWAETHNGRVHQRTVTGPGEVIKPKGSDRTAVLAGLEGNQLLDSLAVDGEGWVCVATILNGGVTAISPDGSEIEHVPTGDPVTTNVCFGGDELRTAYVTCSSSGRLVSCRWPRAGLALAHMS